MEGQELEITSQTDASNIMDLTNTENSEITEKTEVGSAVSVNNKKIGKFRPKTKAQAIRTANTRCQNEATYF